MNIGKISLQELLASESANILEKLIQVIPKEMFNALKASAELKGTSVNAEVIARLVATLIEPNAFGFSPLLNALLHQKKSQAEILAEACALRRAWMCVYELDKLRLYLELEDKLPKDFKEKFTVIDVDAQIEILRRERGGL